MKRFRWYRSDIDRDTLRRLKNGIVANDYSGDQKEGFRLDAARPESLTGDFVVKREITEEVEDPLGHRMSFQRVSFDVVRFRLSCRFPQLELVNPPRSYRTLLTRLAEFTDFTVAIAAQEVGVVQWIAALQEAVSAVLVTRVRCSGLTLSESTSAKFELAGTEDVRRHLAKMLGRRPATVDSARLLCRTATWQALCEITRSGTAAVEDSRARELVPVLRRALLRAVRANS